MTALLLQKQEIRRDAGLADDWGNTALMLAVEADSAALVGQLLAVPTVQATISQRRPLLTLEEHQERLIGKPDLFERGKKTAAILPLPVSPFAFLSDLVMHHLGSGADAFEIAVSLGHIACIEHLLEVPQVRTRLETEQAYARRLLPLACGGQVSAKVIQLLLSFDHVRNCLYEPYAPASMPPFFRLVLGGHARAALATLTLGDARRLLAQRNDEGKNAFELAREKRDQVMLDVLTSAWNNLYTARQGAPRKQ